MSWYKWSKTAATNASADPAVNWAEGQAPSSINDSARAEMASAAKGRDDISGTLTTGGSATAYTLTTNQVFSSLALMSGAMICFIPHATSGASPTLNVDSLGAKAINISTGVAVPTGALILGTPYVVTYVNASTEFLLQGVLQGYDGLQLLSTDAGVNVGPQLDLYRDSASPAANDSIGAVAFNGRDSGGNKTLYARIVGGITAATDGAETGNYLLQQRIAGVLTDVLHSDASAWTISLGLGVTGNFAVNTNKFNVTAASGNTAIAGTLAVTGDASAASASGAMVATQAEQETGSATDKLVTPGRQQFHQSAAKMWGSATMSGGTPTLQTGTGNYNITSITDTAVGRLTVTIATDFSDTKWCPLVSAGLGTNQSIGNDSNPHVNYLTLAAGSVELGFAGTANTLADPDVWYWAGFGDQ